MVNPLKLESMVDTSLNFRCVILTICRSSLSYKVSTVILLYEEIALNLRVYKSVSPDSAFLEI